MLNFLCFRMRPNKKSLLAQCANNLRKANSVPRVSLSCMRMSAKEESMSFVCFLVSSQLFAGVCVCVCVRVCALYYCLSGFTINVMG